MEVIYGEELRRELWVYPTQGRFNSSKLDDFL